MVRPPLSSPLFPYTPLFRPPEQAYVPAAHELGEARLARFAAGAGLREAGREDHRELGLALQHFLERFLGARSEEHTSELQSQSNLVCRLLLGKKNLDGSQKS